MQFSILTFASVIASALALQVNQPAQNTIWTVGQDQVVQWNSVSTDPGTFSAYLVNFARYPTQTIKLQDNVDSTKGSLTISGTYLQPGSGWQINFVKGSNIEQIYAQSNQFTIVSSSLSTSAGASTARSTSGTPSTSARSAAATGVASNSSIPVSSGTIASNSSSTVLRANSGASVSSVSGAALAVGLGALVFMF